MGYISPTFIKILVDHMISQTRPYFSLTIRPFLSLLLHFVYSSFFATFYLNICMKNDNSKKKEGLLYYIHVCALSFLGNKTIKVFLVCIQFMNMRLQRLQLSCVKSARMKLFSSCLPRLLDMTNTSSGWASVMLT